MATTMTFTDSAIQRIKPLSAMEWYSDKTYRGLRLTVARIVALAAFTKDVTDDDAIDRLFDVRSCMKSDACKVRNALRPIMGEFLTLARARMAEVA